MRTAGRNMRTGWRLIAVVCFVTFSGNLFFLGNSVEASGSNRPNPHKVRRAPTAQVDNGDNTASRSPGNTSENVTGTPSTVAGNSVNNASGNGVGNFTASPTQSSLTRNISSVVLGNPAAGMSPTLGNRDSSGIIARNVSGGTPNFLRILENAGLKDAPGNIPRNVSDTEEWWASSILFPKVWESVVDAGVEWTKYNASLDCSTALREYAASLLKKEAWAVRIYDSSGKEGAGMVVGGLTQHGNYDECLNARHYHELEPPHVTQFHKTQYCSAFFDTPAWMAQFVKTLEVPYPVKLPIMTVDLCVPATCTERDIHTIISTYLQNRNHNITTKNVECFHHADITHDPAALIAIAILSVIVLLVMLGTCLDVLSRLQSIEVVTGETTHVGMERRHSRLSRFRHSLVHHFHHIIGTESSGPTQYRPMQRRATIGGYKPSIMRRVSNSLIKRRPSHADADATSGGGVTDTRSEGGGERNSGIVASDHGSPVAPPRYSKKHAFHLGHYRKTKEHNGLMRHRSDTYLIHPETGGSDNTLISAAHKSDTNRFKFGPQRSVSLPEGHTGSFRTDDASEVTEMADNRVNISSTAATSDTNLNGNEGEAPNRCADKPQVQNEKLQSLADAGSRSTESTDRTTVEGRDSHRTDAFAKYLAETGTEHKVDGIEDGKNVDTENCALQENNESTIKDNTKQDSTSTNTNAGNASSVGNEDSGIETESAPQESTAEAVDELGNRTESLVSGKKPSSSNPNDEKYNAEIKVGEHSTQIIFTSREKNPADDTSPKETPPSKNASSHVDETSRQETPSTENALTRPSVAAVSIESDGSDSILTEGREVNCPEMAEAKQTRLQKLNEKKSGLRLEEIKASIAEETGPHSPSSPSTPRRSPMKTFHDIDESLRRKMVALIGEAAEPPASPKSKESLVMTSLTSIPEETPEQIRKVSTVSTAVLPNGNATSSNATTTKDNNDNTEGVRLRPNRGHATEEEDGGGEHEKPAKRRRDIHAAEAQENTKKSRSLLPEVLLCFSFLNSTRKVMAEGSADHLFSLNGVRVLSISWIVLGNTVSLLHATPTVLANNIDAVKMAQTMWFQAPMNGTLAADSFFVLSGCLVTYHFLLGKSKQLAAKKGKPLLSAKSVFFFYVHRLMRILPCYYVVILAYTVLLPYMGYGPRWTGTNQGLNKCRDHWWANALLFSNFYKADEMCMPWTYYLVNDFQFYLLSPLVLYPLLVLPWLGLLLLVGLVAIQIVSSSLLTNEVAEHGSMLAMHADFFSEVYVKPYCRVGAYAVGMGLGYFLFSTQRQIYFKKLPLLLGWAVAVSLIGTIVYVTHTDFLVGGTPWTTLQTALYEAFSRPVFSMGLAWIIFTCSVGQGGFVNRFLSWNAFMPLCRITYGVYLLHPVLITVVLNSSRYLFYLHFGSLIYMFVSNLIISYCLAFFLITLVECPFTKLDLLLRKRFS